MVCTTVTVGQAKPTITNVTAKQVTQGTFYYLEISWFQDITGDVKVTVGTLWYSIVTGTGQRTNVFNPVSTFGIGTYNVCVEPV